jgi:chromosome partitioning protein
MNIVSILGQKGGTGKTTIAAAMAVAAAKAGRTVAVLDLDPQTNIAEWGDQRAELGKDDVTVISCQAGRLPHVIKTAEQGGADLVIIDTAGSAAEPAIAAAKAAATCKEGHLVLIPLQPHMFDIRTLKGVTDVLMLAGSPRAAVIVSQAISKGKRHLDAAEGVAEKGFDVCPTVIHRLVGHGDPGNVGLTSLDCEPDGQAAKEILSLYAYVETSLSSCKSITQ